MQSKSPLFGSLTAGATVSSSSTVYAAFGSSGTTNAVEANAVNIMPYNGRLSRLYIYTGTSQHSSGALTATLRINGVATSIQIVIAADAAAGAYSDLTHSVPVASGDHLSLEFANGASGTSAAVMAFSCQVEIRYPADFGD